MPDGDSGHGLRGVARSEDGSAPAAKENNHRRVLCSTGGGRVDTKEGSSLVYHVSRAIPLSSSPHKSAAYRSMPFLRSALGKSPPPSRRLHRSGRHRLHGHEKFREPLSANSSKVI